MANQMKIDRNIVWELTYFLDHEIDLKDERIKEIVKGLKKQMDDESNKEILRMLYTKYKTSTDEAERKTLLDLYHSQKNN